MKELKPYKTLSGLQKALDNGGRFYNLMTKADDNKVTRAELAKAAGVFSAGMNAFLFLEMAQQDLAAEAQKGVMALLETNLRREFLRNRPQTIAPSQVERDGVAGKSVVVCGYPRFVEDRTEMKGFVMVPIMAGKVMTIIPVPIIDKFDVYEVFDDKKMTKPNSVVATVRGKKLDHDGPIRFGGVLRKIEFEDKTNKHHQFYLETVYYTKLAINNDG